MSNTISPKPTPASPEQLARLCAECAANKKAEDIVVLDVREVVTFTDFFVICTGTSEPHLKAIAAEIQQNVREQHVAKPHNVDGYPVSQWIVVDYYDVLVHIFHPEKRSLYSLEDLWSDAPRLTLEHVAAEAVVGVQR